MRSNLDALSTELYNAISNWNDFTEGEDGDRLLSEAEVDDYAVGAYQKIREDLFETGLI